MSALTEAGAKIRLTDTPPVACSSCYSQAPEALHVDFNSAWDGPVLNQAQVAELGVANVQIDDLVLCETCVRAAAALLPENDQWREMAANAERIVEESRGKDAYIRKLEQALAAKPKK